MDSCYISNKIFTKCFFIFRSFIIITWARGFALLLKAASCPSTGIQTHFAESKVLFLQLLELQISLFLQLLFH